MTSVPIPPITEEQIASLLRTGGEEAGAYFETITSEFQLEGLYTTVRFHRIAHDGTLNKPNISKLTDKLISLLIEFACTRAEIAFAKDKLINSNSPEAFGALQEKARGLFTSSSTTGEPGEVLLYMLAERVLGYPQILCKFPLKTSANVHAHGADGVHATIDPITKHLKLFWGEAKFKAAWSTALKECMQSLAELILEPIDGIKSKNRDIQLIRDNIELDNPEIEEAICNYLNRDKALNNKVKYCGLAVVGFNYADYEKLADGAADFIGAFIKHHSDSIKSAVERAKLEKIEIEFFCIPCSSVDEFRQHFRIKLGLKHEH